MKVVRVIGRIVLIVVTLLGGIVAGAGAFLGAAMLTDQPWLIVLAGLAALALVTTGGVTLAQRGAAEPIGSAGRLASAGVAATVVTIAALAILPPLDDGASSLPEVPGQEIWDLPTGSRLAVVHVPAEGEGRSPPVIYLHGGPGISELPEATAAFGQLAADGFDVYLYDQIGVGRSERLGDPTGYTVAQDIADLEAVRERIGSERVILIGHSWGATLAAAYLAAHPEHVERVVFSAPGALALRDYGATGTGAVTRLTPEQRSRVNRLLYQPRALAAWALTRVNPRAAHAFASDRELDAYYDRIIAASAPGLFCDPTLGTALAPRGAGYYANQVTLADPAAPDPRDALSESDVPALILKPECDYLPWEIAVSYRDTLPRATMVYLPDAGHQAYLEQPEIYFAVVRAFLHDEPLPLPAYQGESPPPDYRGAR